MIAVKSSTLPIATTRPPQSLNDTDKYIPPPVSRGAMALSYSNSTTGMILSTRPAYATTEHTTYACLMRMRSAVLTGRNDAILCNPLCAAAAAAFASLLCMGLVDIMMCLCTRNMHTRRTLSGIRKRPRAQAKREEA